MKTTYFFNPAIPAHGVDITTDKGERFGIACPDERTARTLAAGVEAVELLRTVTQYEHDPKIGAMIDQFFTNLHAGKPC